MPDENRARMTLGEADERLRTFPTDGTRYIVANADGSFSVVGHKTPESKILEQPVYDTIVVATKKTTTKPGDFAHVMQQAAAEPIILRNLIQHLIATYRPPSSRRIPDKAIRVRTLNAYTTMGYLRRYVSFRRPP